MRAARDAADWVRAVGAATERIRAGELTKVVLARELCCEGDVPIDPVALLHRLRSLTPPR